MLNTNHNETKEDIIFDPNDPEIYYLVAINGYNQSKSHILKTFSLEQSLSLAKKNWKVEIDVEEYEKNLIGRGYQVCLAVQIDDESEIGLDDFEIKVSENERLLFTTYEIVKDYYLTEGKFAPGIYNLSESTEFFKLKNKKDFFKALSNVPYTDSLCDKVVFYDDKVEFISDFTQNPSPEDFIRYPFTYFDLQCPFCDHLVMTYESIDNESPCNHYGGRVYRWDNYFHRESIEDLDYECRVNGNNTELYFKKLDGGWEKVFLYEADQDPLKTIYTDGEVFIFSKEPIQKFKLSLKNSKHLICNKS